MSEFKRSALLRLPTLMSLMMGVFISAWLLSLISVRAQSPSLAQEFIRAAQSLNLPAGTQIPVKYDQGEKILLAKEDSLALTLKVAGNITNAKGIIIIPSGSEIVGEIKPTGRGAQFFSQRILLKLDNQPPLEKSLDAISQIIARIETLVKGVNVEQIIQGATLGEMANNILSGFREKTGKNDSTSILNARELEALAGWLLGSETIDLISINPNKDLNLTLKSDFALDESPPLPLRSCAD